MQQDPEYRRNVTRFRSMVLCLTILYTLAVFFFAPATVLFVTGSQTAIILNVACLGVLSVAYTIYIVLASFRMQEFMNDRVAQALPGQAF